MPAPNAARRTVVKILALGTAGALAPQAARVRGGEPPRLEPGDPKARELGYVEDAAAVDVKKYPAFVPGSNCGNCLQLQGAPGAPFRPCAAFAGRLVPVGGWCSAWAAEI